jgi:hypothetical protein
VAPHGQVQPGAHLLRKRGAERALSLYFTYKNAEEIGVTQEKLPLLPDAGSNNIYLWQIQSSGKSSKSSKL